MFDVPSELPVAPNYGEAAMAEEDDRNRKLKEVEHLLEDAEREREIAEEANRKEAADLAEAKRELEEIRHPALVTIYVDGTPYEEPPKEHITYAAVVTLAHPDYPQHPQVSYSVTYTGGPKEKPEGILPPGGSVKLKEAMAFRVNRTGQS
jgi:hypothetical protein